MNQFTAVARIGLAATVLSSAAPVFAQAWIGQIAGEAAGNHTPGPCRRADPPPPEAVAEARAPALAAMRLYWERASTADAADVSAAFHVRYANWVSGKTLLGAEALTSINDPLARHAGAALAAEPAIFVLASDRRSARGVWRVDAGAAAAGYYLADFGIEHHLWKLDRLEVVDAMPQTEITQYCRQPGDFEAFQMVLAERQARRAAEHAAEAARRAARR
jgi:hypothetical protein